MVLYHLHSTLYLSDTILPTYLFQWLEKIINSPLSHMQCTKPYVHILSCSFYCLSCNTWSSCHVGINHRVSWTSISCLNHHFSCTVIACLTTCITVTSFHHVDSRIIPYLYISSITSHPYQLRIFHVFISIVRTSHIHIQSTYITYSSPLHKFHIFVSVIHKSHVYTYTGITHRTISHHQHILTYMTVNLNHI